MPEAKNPYYDKIHDLEAKGGHGSSEVTGLYVRAAAFDEGKEAGKPDRLDLADFIVGWVKAGYALERADAILAEFYPAVRPVVDPEHGEHGEDKEINNE